MKTLTKEGLIAFIIVILLSGCAVNRKYYPLRPFKTETIIIKQYQYKYNRFDALFNEADSAFNVWWKDDIRNPENAEFVDEVSFNEDIPFCRVTQEQFNKRYEIR